MYRQLAMFNFKGIKECRLSDLGRMNALCGKNNSGKSTVLEAMTKSENTAYGIELNQEDAEQIYLGCASAISYGHPNTQFDPIFRDIIFKVCSSRELWFSNESVSFTQEVSDLRSKNGLIRQYTFNEGKVRSAFESKYNFHPKLALLPPKRRLELRKEISGGDGLESNGVGLLNWLFLAKNMESVSEERQLYDAVQSSFNEISSGYHFGLFMEPDNTCNLRFSLKDSPWIPAENSGLGLQDLLVILWFSLSNDFHLVLIEEPESHLHPEMQRKLLSFLHDQTQKQFFFSTHSNVFVNSTFVDRVYFTKFEGSIHVKDATSRASILGDIGYDITDNLTSDLVVLVEGPSDVRILEEYFRKMGLFGPFNIRIWPMGGDIMDQLDLSVFSESYNLVALVDKDPSSSSVRQQFSSNCESAGIEVHTLQRYSIENYFSLRSLRNVFGAQIDESINSIDPNKRLEDQIGINVKRNARCVAREMFLDELDGTDLSRFLNRINEILQSTI